MLFNSTEHVLFNPLGKPEEKILIEIALPVDVVFRRISSNISGRTGPIFTIFSPYETLYVPMMDQYCVFEFVKGRYHGNQL